MFICRKRVIGLLNPRTNVLLQYKSKSLASDDTWYKRLFKNTTLFYPNEVPLSDEGLSKWKPGCGISRTWHYWLQGERTTKRFDENSKLIVVDGPIGAGKSTIAKQLAEQLGMKHYPEVTANWFQENILDGSIDPDPRFSFFCDINKFYTDPKSPCGHSARLQLAMFCYRYMQYATAVLHLLGTGQGVVLERSPYSNFAFKDSLLDMGYISDEFYQYMTEIEKKSLPFLIPPHLQIYFDISPEESYRRIQESGSDSEKLVDIKYLEKLDENYRYHLSFLSDNYNTITVQYDWSKFGRVSQLLDDIALFDFSEIDPWNRYTEQEFFFIRMLYQDEENLLHELQHPRVSSEIVMTGWYGQQFVEDFHKRDLSKGVNRHSSLGILSPDYHGHYV